MEGFSWRLVIYIFFIGVGWGLVLGEMYSLIGIGRFRGGGR